MPWIWGGQGFFPRQLRAPWARWPSAELRVPRHLIVARAGRIQLLSFVDEDPPHAGEHPPRLLPLEARAEPTPPREAWVEHAKEARQAVVQGALNKLVPVRATRFCLPPGARYEEALVWDALGGAPGARYVWRHAGQAFVGRTPERLVAVSGDRLQTVALAGTAPRHADPQRDAALGEALLTCPKTRDEHQAVVRGIDARLESVGLDLDPPPAPRLRRLAEAQHVETPLGAARNGLGLWSLVEGLHPTPALGGAPQAEASRWLREHELLERGWFGAPLGWVDRAGDGEAWVTIRGALLTGSEAWAYAGAGVVAGSDPAAEWDETELKLRAVSEALHAARVEDR